MTTPMDNAADEALVALPRCRACDGVGHFENGIYNSTCDACHGHGVTTTQIADLLAAIVTELRAMNRKPR